MNPAVEKLVKYLRLEADRGYDNRAVVGGLQCMLEPWEAEARAAAVPEALIEVVVSRLRDYPRLSPTSRKDALRGMWSRVRADFPDVVRRDQAPAAAEGPLPSRREPVAAAEARPAPVPREPEPTVPEPAPSPAVDALPQAQAASLPEQPSAAAEPELLATPEPGPAQAVTPPQAETPTEVEAPPALPPTAVPEVELPTPLETETAEEVASELELEEVPEEAAVVPAAPAPTAEPPRKAPIPQGPPPGLDAPLTAVQGIGPKSAKTLGHLGLETLGDLLWHLPRRYDDYSQLKTINRLWYGEEVTVIGTVDEIQVRPTRSGKMRLVEAVVSDGTGALRVTWFNQPWIAERLRPSRPVVLSGKVEQYLGRLTMNSPEWEPLERQQLHTNRIVPVYPLTAGVTAKWLRRVISSVVARLAPRLPDPIPPSILASAELMPRGAALQQVHFPDSWEQLRQAQHRLAFDEMFLLQLGVMRQKRDWSGLQTSPFTVDDGWIERFQASLPYKLTAAQQDSLKEVRQDLAATRPMNRLLQGDVGSGKTVIAAAAIAIVVANGAQAAMMAPTSILADQHLRTLQALLLPVGIRSEALRLLIGATPEAEKEEIRRGLADGTIQVVVGTHALLEDPVGFARLGLAIVDEQHRFGVEQRATLRAKGTNPHLLVMTATPIPRSLALTLYGDLDLSVMDEMPAGRQPIETRVLRPAERARAYAFVRSQIEAGHQAFIIYPLVEGSEKVEAKAAVDEHDRLQQEVFPGLRLGLLHGRMKPDEKDSAMAQFRAGECQILVSTSVVEIGLDIPNATVTLIEGANRFGLSQLHQFRGRVGRAGYQSYCLLIPDTEDEAENQRLKAMETTNDGFRLAELDLEQRGPGDFLGTRQSGFAELRMANLTDVRLIEKARREALRLFEADPDMSLPHHQPLAQEMARFWSSKKGEMS
jgi:ATP-dependent DNA helicase RecG